MGQEETFYLCLYPSCCYPLNGLRRTKPGRSSIQPVTRYAKSGDVHVAYQVFGEGPINLILAPYFVSNIEVYWEHPAVARWLLGLVSFARGGACTVRRQRSAGRHHHDACSFRPCRCAQDLGRRMGRAGLSAEHYYLEGISLPAPHFQRRLHRWRSNGQIVEAEGGLWSLRTMPSA